MGIIVVGLSALTVMELETSPRTKTNATDPFDQLTIDVGLSPDTLVIADRLEMHHLQHEAPLQPVSPVESSSEVTPLAPRNSSTELGANNRKDVVGKLKPKNTASKPRPNRTNSNKVPATERSKTAVEVKPCRPNALDSLLQGFKLSSRCQT